MQSQQLPLFPTGGAPRKPPEIPRDPPTAPPDAPLSAHSSISAGIGAFHDHMLRLNWSPHTLQAFGGDLNLFRKHAGANRALDQISTETLNQFLHWLRYERGVPCKPKSFERRLTTLKVFFAWLAKAGTIAHDPAAPIPHQPVVSALPEILYEEQVTKLLAVCQTLREGEKPDARPYLLVTLLLTTGIKKSEAMAIRLTDIDLSNPTQPALLIRYSDARKRHKERKLKLPADFAASLAHYREKYQPRAHLFECTARNLEYILTDLAKQTGLGETVSFESLRWTCAVRDYQAGMSEDHIRLKMGLSTITWEEAGDRIKRLAAKPL